MNNRGRDINLRIIMDSLPHCPEKTIRVLYVDDEPGLQEVAKLFLEESGEFTVGTATSAQEVLTSGVLQRYDAVISDYQMPGMDGIGFLKAVRSSGSEIPFILFTGRGREEIVIEAINNGADSYIQKGGDPSSQFADLAHKVRQAVEKKRAEHSLKDSEKRLTDMISFLPDATFAIDTTGHVIAWNRAMEEMSGVPAAEMLGRGDFEYAIPFYGDRRPVLIDLIDQSDEELRNHFSEIHREGTTLSAETAIASLNKEPRVLSARATRFFNETGELTGAIESIRDITPLRHAETALKNEQQYTRMLLDASPAFFVAISADGKILAMNRALLEALEYLPEEVRGVDYLTTFVPEEDRAGLAEVFRQIVHEGKETTTRNRIISRSGNISLVEWHGRPVRHEKDKVDFFVGVGLDITGRKAADEALRESEERFVAFMNNLPITAFIKDDQFTNLFVNRRMEEVFGAGEWIGRSVRDLFPEDAAEKMIEDDRKTLQEGYRKTIEIIPEKNGSLRIFETHKFRIDRDNKTPLIGGFALDITDKKLAEDALKESERLYRSVIENIQDVFYRSDLDGNLIMVSPSGATLLGYDSVDEILGKPVAETFYFDPADRAAFLAEMRKTGSVSNFDTRLKKKDGSVLYVSTNSHYYHDQSGAIAGIEGTIRDITERRRAEEARYESEAKYSSLSEVSDDLIFVIDRDDRITYVNTSAAGVLGIPAQEIIGRKRDVLFPEEIAERQRLAIQKVFATGEKIRSTGELRFGGKARWFHHALAPIRDASGNVVQVLGISRDISDLIRVENALRLANTKLGLLSGITRHDIRNQLLILDSYLTLTEKSRDNPELIRELVKKERQVSQNIALQISFSRDYETLGVKAPAWQNVNKIARNMETRLPMRNISLDAGDGRLEVFADPLVEKVFYNLIDNALKYGGEKMTAIRIGHRQEGNRMIITVEDDGVGISSDDKRQLFTRGFGKHLGLGLFLSREILAITGITITETGEPGNGARFEILVPEGAWRYEGKNG